MEAPLTFVGAGTAGAAQNLIDEERAMRGLLVAAAACVALGCTPRNNRDADLELEQAPEEAVRAEPTVVGGAYDSIIYRIERERGVVRPAHGAADDHGLAGEPSVAPAGLDTVVPPPDSGAAADDSAGVAHDSSAAAHD